MKMSAEGKKNARQAYKNHIRKRVQALPDSLDVERLKINLGQLVVTLASGVSGGGKVQAYQEIADRMNELAERNGNAWSWNYVALICSGKLEPGKKFLRVLNLLLEDIHPRAKCWYYFARYHSVAAVYDKCLKRELITEHMQQLGYKAVNFTRYMQLKSRAVRSRK
jgi:hypothetical protein